MSGDYDESELLEVDPELFDSRHWLIKGKDGVVTEIEPPAIQPDDAHFECQFLKKPNRTRRG